MKNTEEKIRDSAINYFLRYGFKKTSIDEIAEDAGVGKGTVYNYFKNKQDLFTKTSICWRAQQFKLIEHEIAQIEHADEKIIMRLVLDVSAFRQAYIQYGMTKNTLRELLSVKESIEELRRNDIDIFEKDLLLGIKQNLFHEHQVKERAALLNTILYQFAERWVTVLEKDDAEREMRTMFGLILDGMKK